ncbi:MAG TPA: hypothetical protein VGL11_05900 [Candidatus Binatia bacterium]|jgi:mono/diheme cytochrome c family protein
MPLTLLLFFALILAPGRPAVAQTPQDLVSRGQYIFTAVQGCACHTPRNPDGANNANLFMAGAPPNPPPFGNPPTVGWTTPQWKKLYARNITPDPETGIGKWSEADFSAAMTAGRTPEGRILDPVMPWSRFQAITDSDLRAIWAYVKTLKPIRNRPPANVPADK